MTSQGCAPPGGGCSGTQTLTASSGTFSDGSGTSPYSNNADCRWLIQPSNASSITLTFQSFALLSGDSVIVYDGNTLSAPRLGAFSGSTLPPALTSSGGVMLVRFLTNASGTADGFVASYTTQLNLPCYGTQVLTQSTGSFTDGSGGNNYRDNSDCRWVIQPGSGTGIRIEFTQFRTESGYDFVTIYDGPQVNSRYMVRRFSGTALPPVVTTSTPEATVYFTSDGNITDQGWSLNYTLLTQPYCQGTMQLTAPAGTLSDGSGSSDYTNRTNCRWLIQPPGASWIQLSFSSFNTEANYDFVRVYDGATTSSPLLGSFSGSSLPSSLTSTGGSMLIVFTSDSSITRAGWEASYTSNGASTSLGGSSAQEVWYYPVPAGDRLVVVLPTGPKGWLTVYDSQGRYIWDGAVGAGENELFIQSWPAGLYVAILQREGSSMTFRFVHE
ncbi:MAG: T9SS type A sorting domain-containing protein [Bacteroidia bacterium]|nr:T9SS type A sorting domain-containing protein [Bacteroidia bacterium]